jgi:hypothetical protein
MTMKKKKVTIFAVVVPWDYTGADVTIHETKEDAQIQLDGLSPDNKHYATIQEFEIEV